MARIGTIVVAALLLLPGVASTRSGTTIRE